MEANMQTELAGNPTGEDLPAMLACLGPNGCMQELYGTDDDFGNGLFVTLPQVF